MKYLTLLQFTKSKMLLENYKHSLKAILLYGIWMFIMQWIWFISIFSKPKYKWKEEEKYKDEEIYDEETNDFVVCCGNCEERLDLQLRNAWDTLPEKISKFNEKD